MLFVFFLVAHFEEERRKICKRFSSTFASFQFPTIKYLIKTHRIYFKSYTFCTKYLVQFKIACFSDKTFIKTQNTRLLGRFRCFKSICKDSMIAKGGTVSTTKIGEIMCILQKYNTFKCK